MGAREMERDRGVCLHFPTKFVVPPIKASIFNPCCMCQRERERE